MAHRKARLTPTRSSPASAHSRSTSTTPCKIRPSRCDACAVGACDEEAGPRSQRPESKAEGQAVSQPTCANCGAPFAPYRSWQRFCTPRCRFQAWDRDHPRGEARGIDTTFET